MKLLAGNDFSNNFSLVSMSYFHLKKVYFITKIRKIDEKIYPPWEDSNHWLKKFDCSEKSHRCWRTGFWKMSPLEWIISKCLTFKKNIYCAICKKLAGKIYFQILRVHNEHWYDKWCNKEFVIRIVKVALILKKFKFSLRIWFLKLCTIHGFSTHSSLCHVLV